MTDKILGRDDFLSGNHLVRELVPVPELEGSIWMRELTTDQLIAFRKETEKVDEQDKADGKESFERSIDLMALAMSLSICDEQGVLLFSQEEVKQLAKSKVTVLKRLSAKALALSGMVLDVSEVAANLKKANQPVNSSPSVLPKNSTKRKRK